jgi:MurNAc alpha-1-phosphate uridylyltransferase
MKAMLLAAGRGERLRPLTDHIPKPLVPVAGKPLIAHHLEALVRAGYEQVVINISHLREKIRAALGNGDAFGIPISYSDEGDHRLETGGGIFQALPLLGPEPFLVMNSDIWCDHPLTPTHPAGGDLAHLVLVNNPPDHKDGDFNLDHGRMRDEGGSKLTFAGIAWYRPEFFATCTPGRFPLAPILRTHSQNDRISAEHYQGTWLDLGSFERLKRLEALLANSTQD